MQKRLLRTIVFAALINCSASASWAAGPNDFFGGTLPGAVGSEVEEKNAQSPAPAAQAQDKEKPQGPTASDYTDDEKRMQRKYKFSLKHAKDLIAKGDEMMSKAPNHDDKAYKKGKIMKEIGEKALNELKSNNPFPDEPDKGDKKKPKDTVPESL